MSMRVLPGMTKAELDYYTSRPTAEELRKKALTDGITPAPKDKVEISEAAKKLQGETQVPKDTKSLNIEMDITKLEENKYRLSFKNSAMLHRAVKQGYVEIGKERLLLTEEMKKALLAQDKKVVEERKSVALANFLRHEAAASRQQSDAMEEANAKMSRCMMTARRIMKGRKVSSADERELMEFNPDLYAMAKNAAALERHRHRKQDKEDERISAENDAAREKEAEPKDYSVEDAPLPEYKAEVTAEISSPEAEF